MSIKFKENKIIAALATSLSNTAAINIVRISGENCLELALSMFCSKSLKESDIQPLHFYLGRVNADNVSDKAFLVYFKSPKSYTGEDMVEFHLHGGYSVANAVLSCLYKQGASPAQAGEFTKRAFLNAKLTLDEAEGICDIINAQSEAQTLQAFKLMSGQLSKTIYQMENELLTAFSNVEVMLDYPEETEDDLRPQTLEILNRIRTALENLLLSSQNRRYITNGITVALAGLTNVGKSSLMNALLKDERAIVTDIAGTTRDTISESFEIKGLKLNLIDTAGIRQSEEVVEAIGIERAKTAVKSADLVLFVIDLSKEPTSEEAELFSLLKDKKIITVGNKADIRLRDNTDILVEAKNNVNIDALIDLIFDRLGLLGDFSGSLLTRQRHVDAVELALSSIVNAIESFNMLKNDCLALDIRQAMSALSSITGKDVNESVVDKIFSSFCVGK